MRALTARSFGAPAESVHELALMESLVSTLQENVGSSRVVRVKLAVGKLACVSPEALRFSFEVALDGTGHEGASLEIEVLEGEELRLQEVEVV